MGTNLDQVNFKEHTHSVNFSELSVEWLQNMNKYSSLKMLEVTHCPVLNRVLDWFLQEDVLNLLRSCSHMFVIIIEGSFSLNENKENEPQIANLIKKLTPLIVQVRSNIPKISSIFFEIELFQTDMKTSTKSTETHLFQFLFNKLFNRHKTINTEHIAANGSSFDVRISKLLQKDKSYEKLLCEVAAAMKSRKLENFKAVLNLPIENRTDVNLKRKHSRIVDIKDIDLLAMAIENGNVEVVEFLVQFECNLAANVELCWSIQQYECLAIVLDADSPFPNDFDETFIGSATGRLRQTLTQRSDFHQNIAEGNLKAIEKYIEKHPNLKYAYNQNNNSALKSSLDFKQLKVYELLKSKLFPYREYTSDGNPVNVSKRGEVKNVSDTSLTFGKDNIDVMKLCSMSRVETNDSYKIEEYSAEIKDMFESLDKIPEISPILKTVAQSEGLEIVFDFNQRSITNFDPTKAGNTRGSMNIKKNIVYVGAKFDREVPFGRLGTLAHELTHYAILQRYENVACLYEKNCDADFDRVYEKCLGIYHNNISGTDQIIRDAFDNYDSSAAHAELVARPPHLLALYQDDPKTLMMLEETFSDLFDYYQNKVLKDLEDDLAKRHELKRKKEEFGRTSKKLKFAERTGEITSDSSRLEIRKYPSIFKNIDPNFHLKIDFNLLRPIDALKVLNRHEFKIVTIDKCSSLSDAVKMLTQTDFAKSLNESKVFLLIVTVTSADESVLIQKISEKITKPMILQLNTGDIRSIFFQETNKGFKKLELTDETGIKETSLLNCIDFETMCNLLLFKSDFGKFNFNLIETEVAMEKSICGLRLIDWAVKHNNMLCLMFLQLFNPDFKSFNDNSTRVLEVAAESGTMQCFEILLSFGNTENMKPSLKKTLHLNSVHDESLLMIAARHKKLGIVKFLLSNDLDVNHKNTSNETASDIAWKNKSSNTLIELLYNDAPFPTAFSEKQVEQKFLSTRIKLLRAKHQSFHDAIANKEFEKVKSFVEEKNFKFLYDQHNQCALTASIVSKNFEAYSFLRSRGFSGGIDSKLEKSLKELNHVDRENLMKSNRKYFPGYKNQHVMDLVSKSKLAFENDEKNFEKIQKWFEQLDSIPQIRPILKIASSNKVYIVFDFNNNSTEEMDPTGSKQVYGSTYFESGYILIAAKQENDDIVLGILAHELTHYVLELVYMNSCLPFYNNDESRKKEYEKIVEAFEDASYKSKNDIIKRAYRIEENKMQELIVRVTQLLALHSKEPEVIDVIREDFEILFDFFEQRTLPDLQREEKLIKPKRGIRAANNHFGVYAKAMQSDLLSRDFERTIEVHEKVFIESSLPEVVLESLVRQMQPIDSSSNNIFVNFEQILHSDNLRMLKKATESEVRPMVFIIDDSNDVSSKPIEEETDHYFREVNIVLISNNKNSAFRKYFESQIEVNFHWNDLSKRSKLNILKTKVIFQDSEVALKDILVDKSLLQETPLKLLLNISKLRLQSFSGSLPKQPRIFIKRGFQSVRANNRTVYNSQDICELLESQKTVILADLAGMGKSISAAHMARELKRQHPLSWVVFIDLKQHTEAFSQDDELQLIDADFDYQKVLKLNSKFEQELFESFYENRKVIFIIDGFDEISPNYKRFVMKLLKAIQHSRNQLIVTTRPQLSEELEKELETEAISLMPFTEADQFEYFEQFWHDKCSKFKTDMFFLLLNLKLSCFLNPDFYSTPINISMLVEVCDSGNLKTLNNTEYNIFLLYKCFIKMKLKIWTCKGPVADDDSVELQDSSTNLKQIHQKLAFEQFFDASEIAELNLPEIPEDFSHEMISRVGIVTSCPDRTFFFGHRTYAEFFIADFIITGIFSENPQKSITSFFSKILVKTVEQKTRNVKAQN